MDCKGARALVTGAAKRIGRAIALELVDAGCEVAVHYHRSQAQADELAERIREMGDAPLRSRAIWPTRPRQEPWWSRSVASSAAWRC